jgi:GPH family glycoside/pentoside/hexuronide:cation symporter
MSTPWLFALANMKFFKGTGGTEVDGMRYVSLMVAAIIIPLVNMVVFETQRTEISNY